MGRERISSDNFLRSLLLIVLATAIFVNSGYYRATETGSYLPLFFLVAVVVFCFLPRAREISTAKADWLLIALLVGMGISILVNFNTANLLSGGRVAVTMLCSYMLSRYLKLEVFVKIFTRSVKVIIVSTVLVQLLLMTGLRALPMLGDYYDLFIVTGRGENARVFGIFWEPGVFASMIVISMLLEYFISGKKTTFVGFVLYVTGMLMTKSTAGMVIFILIILGLLWKRANIKKNYAYTALFILFAFIIVVFLQPIMELLVEVNPELFGKLLETESSTTSTRLNGPLVNLKVFWEKPMFGWGFTDSSTEILKLMPSTGEDKVVAQTSTSTQLMAAIGVLGIAYSLGFILPLFSKKKLSHLSFESKFIVAVCMLLVVNKEPHLFIAASWIMLFYINSSTAE